MLDASFIALVMAFHYLTDFLLLSGFPEQRWVWTRWGEGISPFLARLLFIDYLWIFSWTLYFPIGLILICWAYSRRPPRAFPGRIQAGVFALLAAMVLYYTWFVGSKIAIIPAVPDWAVYFLWPASAAAICLIYTKARKNKSPEMLLVTCAAGICSFLLFRISFGLADSAFFTPLTKDNLVFAVLGLIILGLVFLATYFPLSRLLRVVWRGKKPSRIYSILTPILIPVLLLSMAGLAGVGIQAESGVPAPPHREVVSSTDRDINILLIVADALRADHLGCYGYPRETSPAIDALAREGVLFLNCYVQASWTKPSIASLLTSLYPSIHSATDTRHLLPESADTLAEQLQESGYITYGLVNNPVVDSGFNFHQGYDFFDDYQMMDKIYETALRELPYSGTIKNILSGLTGRQFDYFDRDDIRTSLKRILPWLDRYREQDLFMFLHFLDPHAPYSPPPPYDRIFLPEGKDDVSRDIALYDGEIRFIDDQIKILFDRLKSWDLYDKTLIIFTSDHGEAFGEHGDFLHGHTIYQDQLKVPLIIKFPDGPAGRIIGQTVRSIDISPTILDYLGVKTDSKLEGVSLMSLLRKGDQAELAKTIYIELDNFNGRFSLRGVIRDNRWKLILTESSSLRDIEKDGPLELYDLEKDPGENENVLELKPETAGNLRELLLRYRNYSEENRLFAPQTELSGERMRQIRALGYM